MIRHMLAPNGSVTTLFRPSVTNVAEIPNTVSAPNQVANTVAVTIGNGVDVFVAEGSRPRMKKDWWELLRIGRLNGDRELIRGDGRHARVQFAAHREVVTGRDLILGVVLELDGRPMRCGKSPVDATPTALTGREREVVALVALGRRRREIAAQLFISDATVKTHLRNAMHKLDVHSQAQLVAVALTSGLIELEPHQAAEGSGSTRKPHR